MCRQVANKLREYCRFYNDVLGFMPQELDSIDIRVLGEEFNIPSKN